MLLGTVTAAILACALAAPPEVQQSSAPPAREVSFQVIDRSLREIAQRCSDDGGVTVEVDPEIREWKATAVYHGGELDFLQSLARALDLEVRVRKTDTSTIYQLRLPPKLREHLSNYYAAMRQRDEARSKQDADTLSQAIQRALARGDEFGNKQEGADDDHPLGPNALPLLRLLGTLNPQELGRATYSPGNREGGVFDKQPNYSIQVNSLSPAQRQLVGTFLQDHQQMYTQSAGPTLGYLRDGMSRMDGATISFWTMKTGGTQMLIMSMQFPGMGWRPDFPVLVARRPPMTNGAGDNVGNGTRLAGARNKQSDSTDPPGPIDARDNAKVTFEVEDRSYGESVMTVANASHVNVISDGFTLRERFTSHPKDRQFSAVVGEMEKLFGLRHQWNSTTLTFRSRQWEDRLLQEPTAEVLDHLSARVKESRYLSAEDLVWGARRMTREQVVGLANWHDKTATLLRSAAVLLRGWDIYAWCAGLTKQQWTALNSGGVRSSELSAQLRASLVRLPGGAPLNQVSGSVTLALRETGTNLPREHILSISNGDGKPVLELR